MEIQAGAEWVGKVLNLKKGLFGDPEHVTLEFSLNLKKM